MTEVCLALGANLGKREENLTRAAALLQAEIRDMQVSPWYETAPVGGEPGDGPYLNGALRGRTALSPAALLQFGAAIEKKLGRVRPAPRWSARPLDIDIIFYGGEIINLPELQIPHPLMAERAFVLQPLNDVAPDFIHPVLGLPVRTLWRRLAAAGEPGVPPIATFPD